MKTGKSERRRRQQQQQSGRPVLVTLYIARAVRDGGAAATASAHDVRSDHQHHHFGGGGRESKKKVGGRSYNRRAELLEYSRHLRALARQTMTATQPAPPPRPHCRDTTNTVRHIRISCNSIDVAAQAGVVPDAGRPVAENRLSLAGQQHEQQIRQRCFGGWSWKRVLVLVFPFNSSKSKRPRRRHDDGRPESNRINNQMGWPAALLPGKLVVSREHSGLRKKLMSVFRQRS